MNKQPNFQIRTREEQEVFEKNFLAPYALLSSAAHTTRRYEEPEHPYRTAFQRDRDRIVHSRAFRRLKHKRQVFLTTESDHYRTRITHTLEVAQLSRTMARALGLNEDLVEAIALGHDIGHTPFGHLGEVILHEIMSGKKAFKGEKTHDFGGFKHNYQSLRVVDKLEKKYAFAGLNLTAPVREGIIKHTRLKRGQFDYPDFFYTGLNFENDAPATLEGQVVAICDEIAQRTHDLEDGIRAGLVDLKKIRELEIVKLVEKLYETGEFYERDALVYQGLIINGLINLLVDDVIKTTLKNVNDFFTKTGKVERYEQELVVFGPEVNPLQKLLNKFIYKEIINFSRVKWSDELGEKLLFRLFEAYCLDPKSLPAYVLDRVTGGEKERPLPDASKVVEMEKMAPYFRIVCDYIAGMTDSYAVREADRLSRLNKFDARGLDLGIVLGIQST